MRKYWAFFKANFETFFEYRGDFLINFLIRAIILLSFVFIWKQIQDQGGSLGNYGFNGIVTYYLFTQILDGFLTSRAAKDLKDGILSGNLSDSLIKPLNINLLLFSKDLARILFETLTNIILSVPILLLYPIFSEINFSLFTLIGFTIMSLIAICLNFLIYSLVGYIAFWTVEAGAFRNVIKNSIRFFTGQLLPLDMLPSILFSATKLLPFSYMVFFPIKIILNNITFHEFTEALFISIFWLLVLILINKVIWQKGLKKYESVGI